MAKPIIYVSDKKAEVNGARTEIMTALTYLFQGLVENNVTTKEELHESVDMAFMNNEELIKKLFDGKILKDIDWDDDIAILFYKNKKITSGTVEMFAKEWAEEWQYNDNMEEFLNDVADLYFELDEEDRNKIWREVWDGFKWCEETQTYRYDNWELFVLNI